MAQLARCGGFLTRLTVVNDSRSGRGLESAATAAGGPAESGLWRSVGQRTDLPPAAVLVVDDRPANLLAFEAVLEPLGQKLVLARSGTQALAAAAREPFAVVLMDLRMGDMDGIETTRRLHDRPETRHTPVILLTAEDRDELDLDTVYGFGVVDFIRKPFSPVVVRAKVSVFVQLYQAQRELAAQAASRDREAALRESEHRFRQIAEALPQLVWTAGADGIADYYNERWIEYAGVTPQDLRDGSWSRAVHPDDVNVARDSWRRAVETGQPYELEFRFRGRDGQYRWFLARAAPIRDESGRLVRWFGTTTNIDEQKRAAEAQRFLAEVGKELARSLDKSHMLTRVAELAVPLLGDWCAVDLMDDAGTVTRLAVAHKDPAKVDLARRLQSEYPPDLNAERGLPAVLRTGRTDWMASIPAGLLEAAAQNEEHRRLLRELELASYIVVPLKTQERIFGAITLVSAESRRRYSEADVHIAEELAQHASAALENARLYHALETEKRNVESGLAVLDALFQATHAGLAIFDRDLRYVRVNQALAAINGVPAEAHIGRTVTEVLPEMDQTVTECLARVVRTGDVVNTEATGKTAASGEPRTWLTNYAPVRSRDGGITGVSAVVLDISDRRAALAEVQRLNQELEQRVRDRTLALEEALRELEAFSYSVSHDLRAPLRHITGFSQLLMRRVGNQLEPTAREHLTTIAEAAAQGGRLVDDLLAFSRMGRADLRQSRVKLGQVVGDVVRALAPDIGDRQLQWDIGELPDVRADPAMLRVVLMNLLANAVKYTRTNPSARVAVQAVRRGAQVEVRVTDNGVGFDMQYVDKLFGVFQRLHPAEEFEGTGIGLATVRRIVSRHGGRTWAEGKVGEGASVYFTLPAADPEANAHE